MSNPCCYHDDETGKLRKGKLCHGGFEDCGAEPRCCFCGQTGHLSKDCPAEKWPRAWRAVRDWLICLCFSAVVVYCFARAGWLVPE